MSSNSSQHVESTLRPSSPAEEERFGPRLVLWGGLRRSAFGPALVTAAGTAVLFAIYEILKQVLLPDLSAWHSHEMTILAAAAVAGFAAHLVMSRQELLHRRAIVEAGRRQRAEDDLARLLDFQKVLLDTVDEPIYGVNGEGNAIFVNQAAAALLGWSPGEVMGQPMHLLLHNPASDGATCERSDCPISAGFHSLVPWRGEEVFSRKDGSRVPVEFVCAPFINQGRTAGVVVAFHEARQSKTEAAP